MRTILTTCFLVLLLPWELNGATSLSPSIPSQHGGSAESHKSPSRSEGTTILRSDQPTTELRPEHGVSSSKRPTHFPSKNNLASTSHADHKTTEMQNTKEENESPSSSFSLATSKEQTKRSLEYFTEAQEPSTDEESTILSTKDHNQHSTNGASSSKQSADTSQVLMTSVSHAERKTTEVQITTGKSKSHSSFLTTSRRHTKRSSVTSENNQTTSTPAKVNVMDTTATEKEHQTPQEGKSTEQIIITGNLQQTISKSTEKVVSQQTNNTTQLQTTQGVITNEPVKVSVDHQTKVQTTTGYSQAHENGDTKATTSTTVAIPNTTKSSKNISEVTSKAQTNDSVLPISTSTTKATFIPTTSMASTGPSTGHSTGSSRGSSTGLATEPATGPSTGSSPGLSTGSSTGPSTGSSTGPSTGSSTGPSTGSSTGPAKSPVTGETVTTSMTMDGKTPTAEPTSSLTTQPAKRPTTKKIMSVIPENQDQSKDQGKKNNTGPIVATLIGSAIVLMFIAIAVILLKKRRMQKRQLDNPDWAGPSPFLESEIQPNSTKQADEELFQTKRDTKRISLHSFLPQRLSQRLSLLVEEDVQMNDMVVNSTFGKNENPQNGKPTVQQDKEQEQEQDQDKSQEQKLTDAQTPDGVSSAPGAPEIEVMPAAPVDNGTLQPTSAPGEEITQTPSTETSIALPTPPPFEDVDLSLPQTNPANTSPAPQT